MSDVSQAVLHAVTRRVVDKLTEDGQLFTALDVSNAVKQTLPQVRHREVSPVVRDLFDDQAMGESYTRSLIDVKANGHKDAQAYLYHLDDDDPSMYDDAKRRSTAVPPVSASATDDLQIDTSVDDMALTPGRDGRVRVPRKFLAKAGINTDEVNVHYLGQGPGLVLSAFQPGQAPGITVLRYAHPSLLHVPKQYMDPFDPNKRIAAKIGPNNDTVEIDGTLRS